MPSSCCSVVHYHFLKQQMDKSTVVAKHIALVETAFLIILMLLILGSTVDGNSVLE
jgi:hypothetical protein